MAPSTAYIPPELQDSSKFSALKKSLIKPENIEKVKASWARLLIELDKECEKIKAAGDTYIPSVKWEDIQANDGNIPTGVYDLFKERGVLMVRNVIDAKVCEEWKLNMRDFVTKHPQVGGFIKPDVSNWFAYWTEGEIKARSHPEIIKLMRTMGQMFDVKDASLPIDKSVNMVYPDSFRIRPPGKSFTLDLHLDSGAIERWEDVVYRDVYAPIFEGKWEDFDPWILDKRSFARTDLYSHLLDRPAATSAFRALQGWLALSSVKSGEGTLRVLPNIKLVNAYSLLRPFFWRDDGEIDLETPKFPGATVGNGQYFFSEEDHPHLRQLETVFSLPYVNTGDYVFWHCDVAHEVDKEHRGTTDSSVFFNAYCPLCPYNIDNMLATRDAFLNAKAPRDTAKHPCLGANERDFDDHGAHIENISTEDGLSAMGLKEFDLEAPDLTEGQIKIRKYANEAMKTNKLDETMFDVEFN